MIETHPFEIFVPPSAKYLLLGSFPGKQSRKGATDSWGWFYGNPRNHFWPILEVTYQVNLRSIVEKKKLLTELSIAITDIIYQCERKSGSNLDANLAKVVYNTKSIEKIIQENPIETIYFSSRFVETNFKLHFKYLIQKYPHIKLITLPSPSPRYAAMSKVDKVVKYRELLPKLKKEVS